MTKEKYTTHPGNKAIIYEFPNGRLEEVLRQRNQQDRQVMALIVKDPFIPIRCGHRYQQGDLELIAGTLKSMDSDHIFIERGDRILGARMRAVREIQVGELYAVTFAGCPSELLFFHAKFEEIHGDYPLWAYWQCNSNRFRTYARYQEH